MKRIVAFVVSAALCAAMMVAVPLTSCYAEEIPSGTSSVSEPEKPDSPDGPHKPEPKPGKDEGPEHPIMPLEDVPGGSTETT